MARWFGAGVGLALLLAGPGSLAALFSSALRSRRLGDRIAVAAILNILTLLTACLVGMLLFVRRLGEAVLRV